MLSSLRSGLAPAALLVAALLLSSPVHGEETAAEPASDAPGIVDHLVSGLEVGFDLAILRPLSALHLAVGGGLFVPAATLSFFAEPDALSQTREVFIDTPWENLARRRLGDL